MPDFNFEQKEFFSQHFIELNLSNQVFDSVEFEDCTFKECNFSDATFRQCKFIDCTFVKCNLSLVKIAYSTFTDIIFESCKVIGIDWTKANWPNLALFSPIKFHQCILNDSSFFGLNLQEIVVEECKAHHVDFRDGDFTQASFSGTDLLECLFNKTNLSGVNFVDAVNYHIDIYNNNINKAKFSRYEAVSLLDSLDIELVD